MQELLPELCDYDVVVFSTFPDSHLPLAEQMLQKECRKQTWAFTVHDPREIDQEDRMFPAEGKPRAWAILKAAPSAHVLTLAPHVTARYTEMMAQAGLDIPVATFLPIYPVDTGDADAPAGPPDVPRQGFVLQGMFQSQRRDYGKVFRDIEAQPELMADPTFRMNLIGRGSVEIPAALQSRTVKETSLQYQEYYKRIQGAIAVLPAFATNVYTTLKASSSVAAALVCATPLVADDTLLAAYSYLNATAVFRQEAGETEAATMARIMRLSPPEIRQVAQNMADLQQQLFLENDKVMLRLLSGRR
ncbi:hypothetical protein WJX72_010615 [[Myrmecia] bisecta]|uniref:Uncharacterized protein n=1 Tax=[Myrmecia] bisecta TaxID=41462 RepID=A0AAW1QBC6_9CHLO